MQFSVKVGDALYPDDKNYLKRWRDGQIINISKGYLDVGQIWRKHHVCITTNLDLDTVIGVNGFSDITPKGADIKKYLKLADATGKYAWETNFDESVRENQPRVRDWFIDFEWLVQQGIISRSQYEAIYDRKVDPGRIYIDRPIDTYIFHEDGEHKRLEFHKNDCSVDATCTIGAAGDHPDLTDLQADLPDPLIKDVTATHLAETTAINSDLVFTNDPAGWTLRITGEGFGHLGVWNGAKANVTFGGSDSILFSGGGDLIVDQMQFDCNSSAADGLKIQSIGGGETALIERNILRGSNGADYGARIYDTNAGTVNFWNNIIYGFTEWGLRAEDGPAVGTFNIFHNTIAECGEEGIWIDNDESGVINLKNNLVQNCTGNDIGNESSGTVHAFNLTQDATSPDGVPYINQNCQDGNSCFVNYAGRNFTLDAAGDEIGILDNCTDPGVMPHEDIAGTARTTWYIGAFEIPAGTTIAPTTISPTSLAPTSVAPTSLAPTSLAPTSLAPTTLPPTTLPPTTLPPTTIAPICTDLVHSCDPGLAVVHTFGRVAGDRYIATKFVSPVNAAICRIHVYIEKNGSPTQSVTAGIWGHDVANNEPEINDIRGTSGVEDATGFPADGSPGWYSFDIALDAPITNGGTFWVVLYADPVDAADYIDWHGGNCVVERIMVDTDGTAWALQDNLYGMCFRLYADPAATSIAPTSLPPTSLPPTTLPPTSIPPTSLPPTTLAPTTLPPTSLPPTTLSPTSLSPTSLPPTSLPPTTVAPTSLPPTSLAPTTVAPTSLPPTTTPPTTVHVATTEAETTLAPPTDPPTTIPPTTFLATPAPTTLAPTTLAPTSLPPTSLAPTSLPSTSLAPTSLAPTSIAPTTIAPTTLPPTSLAPTTVGPTTIPPTSLPPTTTLTTQAPTTEAPVTEEPPPVLIPAVKAATIPYIEGDFSTGQIVATFVTGRIDGSFMCPSIQGVFN